MHTIDTLQNHSSLSPNNYFQLESKKFHAAHITEHKMGFHLFPTFTRD